MDAWCHDLTRNGPWEPVYLDNAATTRVRPDVAQAVLEAMTDGYGNASSRHRLGARARAALERARAQVAALIGAEQRGVIFTASATEANNMALFGVARAYSRQGRHIVTTAIEHPSVLEVAAALEALGYEVTRVPPGPDGVLDPSAVAAHVRQDTVLVSVMLVNNETGALQPVPEIARLARSRNPRALVHSDLVQAAGRIPVDVKSLGVDLASLSAHKLHGPKGVGALYVAPAVRLEPLIYGGGQERGLRSGTENIPAIVGFGVAAELAMRELPDSAARLRRLSERLRAGLQEAYPRIVFLGPQDADRRAPHIVSAAFPGLRAEVLATHLDQEGGVLVSTGSACSSHKARTSHVLKAMALGDSLADATIRLSLGLLTREEEIDRAIESARHVITDLAAFLGARGLSRG